MLDSDTRYVLWDWEGTLAKGSNWQRPDSDQVFTRLLEEGVRTVVVTGYSDVEKIKNTLRDQLATGKVLEVFGKPPLDLDSSSQPPESKDYLEVLQALAVSPEEASRR